MLTASFELRARRELEPARCTCARFLHHGLQTARRSFEERGGCSFVDEGKTAQLIARWARDRRIEPLHLRLRIDRRQSNEGPARFERRRIDDENTQRTSLGGTRALLGGGAQVPGHFARQSRWRAAEHHDEFAAYIEPGVVVTFVLGRDDAEARKHAVGFEALIGLGAARACGDVVGVGKRLDALGAVDTEPDAVRHQDAGAQRDRLHEAVRARWLQSDLLVHRSDVVRSQVVATRTGIAALQQIAGEEFEVSTDRSGADP